MVVTLVTMIMATALGHMRPIIIITFNHCARCHKSQFVLRVNNLSNFLSRFSFFFSIMLKIVNRNLLIKCSSFNYGSETFAATNRNLTTARRPSQPPTGTKNLWSVVTRKVCPLSNFKVIQQPMPGQVFSITPSI